MKTEHQFADILKKMMETVPLDEISVVSLSKKCGVSRKTFYYHFRDVYDLLTLVFLDEKSSLKPDEILTNDDLLTSIFNYYSKNAKFVDAALNSAGKDLFQEFIFNYCYSVILNNFINKNLESKKLTANEKKDIARFYSFAYSNTITYYLSVHKNKTLNGLKSCFTFLSDETFIEAINLMKRGKNK